MHLVMAAALYFVLTYAAGFALGAMRELIVVPRAGQLAATLIEAPLILTASYLAARYVIGRFDPHAATAQRLAIGAMAFALLIIAEILLAALLRGWPVAQWLTHMTTGAGALSLALFVLFGLMPLAVRRA